MSTPTTVHDLIIVGSGPAGYTAGIYAGRAGFSPLILAGSITAGGALMNTLEVENFPGFPDGILGPDLMAKMQEQAEKFGADIEFDDAVTLDLDGDVKTITTGSEETYQARTVLLALGSEYRHLGVDGEERLAGRGVSYCATCDGFFFKDKHVVVVGGGDSAMEEALFLSRFASQVTIVHHRDTLNATKILAERTLANPKVSVVWNTDVISINGDTAVDNLTVRDAVTGQESTMEGVSGIFIAIGHVPRTGPVADQVALDSHGYIVVDHPSTRTNLPGVYAAGDVVDPTYRQAITAAGMGCTAALDVQHYLEENPS